jgi:hypothetical protein
MGLSKDRLVRAAVWVGLPVLATLLGGCCFTRQAPLFTASGPGWHVQEGQALWRPRRGFPELGGEVVLASDKDGRCLVQFAKTPMVLLSAETTRTSWQMQFPPRQMSFSGHHKRPTRFVWLFLQSALSGEPLPPPLRFERKPDGGWRLENSKSGETLEGFLAP